MDIFFMFLAVLFSLAAFVGFVGFTIAFAATGSLVYGIWAVIFAVLLPTQAGSNK